jgi:ABC-type transport system involved in multi-copper enzyme maturation permease subunit
MNRTLWTIARFTLLDLVRSRWLWLCLFGVLVVGSSAAFMAALAIAERQEVTLNVIAPFSRLACIAIVALLGAVTMVRDFDDRSILISLAAPISRLQWLLGKWLGLAIVAIATACAFSLPLIALQANLATLMWSVSLVIETILVCALVIAAAITFKQVPTTLFAVATFYLAARLIGLIKLLNDRAPLENAAARWLNGNVIDALALALPRLDKFTATTWLFEKSAISFNDIGFVTAQAMVYCSIALVAACVDLVRRDISS